MTREHQRVHNELLLRVGWQMDFLKMEHLPILPLKKKNITYSGDKTSQIKERKEVCGGVCKMACIFGIPGDVLIKNSF